MLLNESIKKGIEWLVEKQNLDGSWGESYPVSTTGLAVLKLESYAIEIGYSPFDDDFIYKDNIVKGLNFIFNNAYQDSNGVYFKDFNYVNYTTGIILMAVCGNAEPTTIVNVPGSVVDGFTFKFVAEGIVDYLEWSQDTSGGWAYEKGDPPDNSVSGYVTIGLAFAEEPAYKYIINVNSSTKTKLDNWINYIQNVNGGSGYTNPNNWVNILKTGNLIQQMNFYGDDLSSNRLKKAITYIADNWNQAIDTGWKGNPAFYQAIFTTMKGLSSYGIDVITTTGGTDINWFDEMSSVIISQQEIDGSWPRSLWDSDRIPVLSTLWALLTIEKVAPPASKIPFKDNVTVAESDFICHWDLTKTIEISGLVKIFANKYSHAESDCEKDKKTGKGDDIGFTLVFGNYGEFTYQAPFGVPTVEDILFVQPPVSLKLMSLCLCDDMRLYNVTDNVEVEVCDIFQGGIQYKLQVQKWNGNEYVSDFDLPCHSINCVSMLFQVEFPACP